MFLALGSPSQPDGRRYRSVAYGVSENASKSSFWIAAKQALIISLFVLGVVVIKEEVDHTPTISFGLGPIRQGFNSRQKFFMHPG